MVLPAEKCLADVDHRQLVNSALQARLHEQEEWLNLLHFGNYQSRIDKDSPFFLSSDGYRNAEAELAATLDYLFDTEGVNDQHPICRFPARYDFLVQALSLEPDPDKFQSCPSYREYREKVPADEIWVVFAAENNTSPSSMMGHIFIKLQGDASGTPVQHAFSFYGAIPTDNPLFYFSLLTGNLDGIFALTPFSELKNNYLHDEDRALWQFKVRLDAAQRGRLLDHLWELRGIKARYDFIFHNCATAVQDLIYVADPALRKNFIKPFNTPLEFITSLNEREAFEEIELLPTEAYLRKLEKFGLNSLLDAPPSSNIALSYRHLDQDYIGFSFMPVYADQLYPSNVSHDILDTKFLSTQFYYAAERDSFFLERLEVINLRSLIDYPSSNALSKHFRLNLQNRLGDLHTRLYPTTELGFGLAATIWQRFTPYFMGIGGYRYDKEHNLYFSPELGLVWQPLDYVRVTGSWEWFADTNENRGYDGRYQISLAAFITDNIALKSSYTRYNGSGSRLRNEFNVGMALFF